MIPTLTYEFIKSEYDKSKDDPNIMAKLIHDMNEHKALPWTHIIVWMYHRRIDTGYEPEYYLWEEWINDFNDCTNNLGIYS